MYSMPCSCIVSHIKAINSSVHNPHTNSRVCKAKPKVIPGWDYEADCAREESLLSRHIWIESGKPDAGRGAKLGKI